ncbi:MAG: glycosyltransferase family 2 protein [Clostridiaceae bacterium]|jgi:glycosyltransferase involved in cell wall biosynthesis|nr:glycosyltransferase family 2 protein [Clostridiaceae bacterium]
MKTLIIIPAYNEAKNLVPLLDRIRIACPDYDVVVINDCSTDNTLAICKKYRAHVIDLPVNLGIGGAVQAGYKYARYKHYDAAVQVDGDGQHNPEYIKLLVSELENGANICIGSRFISKEGFQSSLIRRLAIRYFSGLIQLFTGLYITDPTSGFRACDTKAISLFASDYPRDYPEPESIVSAARNKLSACEIPVVMNERKEGKSSITFVKSLYYMIKVSLAIVIASFSSRRHTEVDE